ncbi:hypothetical protein scyTo_0009007 [Scyliorhinus torazame]|uniref:WD repeat-containing protein 60 n=1 Tax=Scyliorhinus torazame TaxID=75743 RepID=A0A401PFW9_SCYTO|nr:hypothetical protein [Scyliorhinus torazame]
MKPSKMKTKEDTWKSDELLKHIKAAQGDHADDSSKKSRERKRHKDEESVGTSDSREHRHRGRERDKEREQGKERVRNKDKERDGDRHKEQEHEKVRKKKNDERERDREQKQERERERHNDRDRDKERVQKWDIDQEHSTDPRVRIKDKEWDTYAEKHTKRGHESERHRDKERDKKKERDKLQEKGTEKDENGNQRPKHRQKKDKENLELEMDEKYERKERKHRERKEKEGKSTENNEETKEKKRRPSEFRDEDYDRRYKEHKDHGPHDGHREKREKERREPGQKAGIEEMERKHRVRKDKEDGKKQRHKDIKDSAVEWKDREWEHKDREKRDWERKEEPQRKHKHKVKKERDEKERRGDYTEEQSVKRKKERRSIQETTSESKRKGSTKEQIDSQKKPTETLTEEFVEGEEIAMESQSTIESSNYDNDFEDYEDDFEEGDCEDEEVEQEREEIPARQRAELEAIQKAITAENEQVRETRTRSHRKTFNEEPNRDFENSQTRGPARGTFIDFAAAKQREIISKVASKQKKRSLELLRLIDLDFSVSFSLLDLPPLNEYDVYIKNFGRTNTKQAFVQCNEDNVDRDIQTDEIETVEKWTQHPGEGNLICGGANVSDALSSVAKNVDSRRLTNFLRSACQVISVLLEEDQAENQASKNLQSKAASLSVSDGCSQLNTNLAFLHGREVLCLHFSPVQRQILLSIHSLPKEPGVVQLASSYMVCVWNIWEPSAPQKVLVCESEVQCCCFGPDNVISLFAGTTDGSVVAWDLREHSIMHCSLQIGGQEWTFRTPTFSTDGVLTVVNHSCAVKAVYPVSSACFDNPGVGLSLFSSQEGRSGLSFQLATLDESGLLNLWNIYVM